MIISGKNPNWRLSELSHEKYPDNNWSFETYTCDTFIEIESLGPLKIVQPQETVSLTEHWSLSKKPCAVDFNNDKSLDKMIERIINKGLRNLQFLTIKNRGMRQPLSTPLKKGLR